MKRFSIFLLLLALIAPWAANGQNTITLSGNVTQTIEANTTYNFYDSGGPDGSYSTSQNYTATLTADGDITINFSQFVTESSSDCYSWDYMLIYDGSASTGTLICRGQTGCASAALTINTDYTATSGVMTVEWHSDGSTTAAGWAATITGPVPVCCPRPKNLACTGTTGTPATATFTWTNGGEETQWQLEYGTASDFTGALAKTISQSDLVNGAYTLTGLTAEQTYYARIKAYCPSCTPNYSDPSNTCEFKPTAAQHFTVNDGTTTSDYVPVYGYWADSKQQSEFIIPSTSLTELAGLTLQAMKFYANYNFTSTGTFQVYLREVENSTFSNTTFYGTEGATTVYTGTITVSSTDGMTITFANDGYDYNGGNLLIGFYQATGGNCSSSGDRFYGISANGASISMYSSNAVVQRNFLPKTTFTYLPSSTPKPRNLVVSNITSEGATVTWTAPADNVTGYQYQYKYATTPTWPDTWNSLAANVTHKDLVALAAGTLYDFRVRANYADGDSDPAEIQFTTEATCLPVTNITVSDITSNSAKLAWTPGGSETNWQYLTLAHGDTPDWTSERVITSNTHANVPANIYACTGVQPQPNTEYDFYVRANCGNGDYSEAAMLTFRTACGAITAFPVNYGFETTEGFPSNAAYPTTNQLGDCWRNEATVQNGTNATRVWGTSTSYKHGDSQALVLPDKGNSSNPAKTMLVFPPMDFTSANGYTVSFWIYRSTTGSNPEGFKVYASDTDTISANAVELGHYSRYYNIAYPVIESAAGWYKYETPVITMTGTVYIIFEGQSYYGSATYVDDVTVKEKVVVVANQIVADNPVTGQMTWDQFAQHVNNGDEFAFDIYLMEDITVTTMAGTSENPFKGTFNGNNHTIDVNITTTETGAAPFSHINGATIKYLTVTGTISSSANHLGGLVGFTDGGTNHIENCLVSTTLTGEAGYGLCGGIIGHGKSATNYIEGCVFNGTIDVTNTDTSRAIGGLLGWSDTSELHIINSGFNFRIFEDWEAEH